MEFQVRAWEEAITIPTYPPPPPDPNPMFLERRVNQGASGRVYPNPLTDHITHHEKVDKSYLAVFLENEYIQLIILPELGGRIFGALDKTNGYNFFYRQHVIKPALIGLFGSWISGGMEFNWPQHHRPSTFMPVDHLIEEHADGSCTVWLGEHDPMQRMKGMVGICLYPGRAVIETKVRLYNRTALPQTFLWWENAAVHVNEQYQIFFPPDVTWVTFHSKQQMAHYPIARGVYCGVDFGQGVDIRWHRNSPYATSYFAGDSRYDFFGGYDHGRRAGVIHVANHHISPGKKLFTWGTTDFARSWERHLTDSDGPYAELMAGVYTDNQPDFSWLQPYEARSFSQFWYPFQSIGPAKNANTRVALNLELDGRRATLGVYATEVLPGARVSLTAAGQTLYERLTDLAPGAAFTAEVELPEGTAETELTLCVYSAAGREILRYTPEPRREQPLPQPATPPPPPQEIESVEELYLTGLHVEQYRHPTLDPELYWQEALRRSPGDARTNNALGRLLLGRGEFAAAERHFRTAIQTLTRWNPNPYDGEPYYNLGLTLKYQGRFDEAYSAFYKATWNYAWQTAGYYALAEIDCLRQDWAAALEHLERSLSTNSANLKARNLRAAVLRRLGQYDEAAAVARETVALDPLDFWARNELLLVAQEQNQVAEAERLQRELTRLMCGEPQSYLDIAFDYADAGLWREAEGLLSRLVEEAGATYPMLLYALGYFAFREGQDERGQELYRRAAEMPPDYCFPSRLQEMEVLRHVRATNPQDARAAYYLGNLLYDKRQYEEAIRQWEDACRLDPDFSIPWRNLGLAYYNVRRDMGLARECYLRALACAPGDVRLFYEFDLLLKRLGVPPAERLAHLEERLDLVEQRDALYLERVTLYNQLGQPQKALDLLTARRFLPWEGGEDAIANQYAMAHLLLGREALAAGQGEVALAHFEAARRFPENLGVGRWHPASDLPSRYYAGLALEMIGNHQAAREAFQEVAQASADTWSLMYLPALPYYQAMALKKLGDEATARQKLEELLARASARAEGGFATSLPNFLPFNDDAEKLVRIECAYLIGLAHLGLGQLAEARRAFEQVLALDINHLGAQAELQYLDEGVNNEPGSPNRTF